MKKTRTKHSPAFKAKVALAARPGVGGRDCARYNPANVVYKSKRAVTGQRRAIVRNGPRVLDRLQVLRSAPTPLRGALAATWTPSPRTGVGPLRVPGPGLQPSSHDTTTTRTDRRLHLSKARFWSERWGPPQCIPEG